MEQENTKPEPETLLRRSTQLLSCRDFSGSRKYALLAQQSDPTLSEPDKILAVADVLLAARRRLPNERLDWYSILQIHRPDSDSQTVIRTQFKKLLIRLNPNKNEIPFAQEAFQLVCQARSVLSDPEKKAQYDNEINNDNKSQKQASFANERKFDSNEYENGNETFWTVCPYCYYLYEYDKVYEECCLRCQNCRRAFHGVAVVAPPQSVVVDGKEYYCGLGFFPLEYCVNGMVNKKKENGGGGNKGYADKDNVVEISDDCGSGKKEKARGVMQRNGKTEVKNDGKRAIRNVKSVARNTKKMMGRGVKITKTELRTAPGVRRADLNVEFGKGSREDMMKEWTQ